MSKELKVPQLGESISEATVAKWYKKVGESVKMDETLVDLETDKVTLEVNAPVSGVLEEILIKEGSEVTVGLILAKIKEGAVASPAKEEAAPAKQAPAVKEETKSIEVAKPADISKSVARTFDTIMHPTGMQGVINTHKSTVSATTTVAGYPDREAAAGEEKVKMSRLRQTISERLKQAQSVGALLTTFNEVDMTAVMELRAKLNDKYIKKHGVKLGFMSFFVKASIVALKEFPAVNAEIAGNSIIYKKYFNVGIAVGTPQGLVVPVIKDADNLDFAGIEKQIAKYGEQARDGKLKLEDMQNGSFTITNGGIYGSMLSTPIISPPQSGILGLHSIKQRPVVLEDGSIAARPIMYVALTYDHRIVDGREAVSFLVRIKDCIEQPDRMLLDI